MTEQHVKWNSTTLNKEFEMLVFGEKGMPVIAFPTSMGRHFQNRDFKLIESVQKWIEAGDIKIYCPDGIDEQSWYNTKIHPADRVRNHL